MIIVALISGILFAAFARVLDIRVRLAAFLEGTDVPTLIAGWFRSSVEGLVPDFQGGEQFSGGPRQFTGLSLAPVDGAPGIPTRITWQLRFDSGDRRTYLQYQSGDRPSLRVASWPGDLGGLAYCGPDLRCVDSWPPPAGGTSQLPVLIRLEAVRGTAFWPILAAPRSALDPLPRPGTLRLPR